MDASDFTNTVLIRLAVSRIVTWISEPKSPEVRKEATAVIVALFQLNSAEFSCLLSNVPNSIQEGATRVIQVRLKTSGAEKAMSGLSLNDSNSDYGNNSHLSVASPLRKGSASENYNSYRKNEDPYDSPVKQQNMRSSSVGDTHLSTPVGNNYSNNRVREDTLDGIDHNNDHNQATSTPLTNKFLHSVPKLPTPQPENDIFGLPHIGAAPMAQSPMTNSSYASSPGTPPISISSPVVNTPVDVNNISNAPASSSYASNSHQWLTNDVSMPYNPRSYEDTLMQGPAYVATPPTMNRVGDGAEHPEDNSGLEDKDKELLNLFNQISTVLGSPSHDSENVKSALQELNKLIRSWDTHVVSPMLKVILPDVLVQLKHSEATIRCLAARSLREVASTHPDAYRGSLHSFIVPLLQTEADTQKEVAKTAEECCAIVGQTLSAEEVIPVIAPVMGDSAYPVNVSAIKMLNVICDNNCDRAVLLRHIDSVVSNLLKAYDHSESSARKSAVFCLVSVHNLAGAEAVTPYFHDLAGSKLKLINLYIRRSQSTTC